MDDLPEELSMAIPPAARAIAVAWWNSLAAADRLAVLAHWDHRYEVHFFAPQADETGRLDDWDDVPAVRGGRFIPHDDAWGLADWGPGYFEHLLQHPELMILWEPAERRFHIGCTRHAAARACFAEGGVPVHFRCPFDSPACPMQPLRGATLLLPLSNPAKGCDDESWAGSARSSDACDREQTDS